LTLHLSCDRQPLHGEALSYVTELLRQGQLHSHSGSVHRAWVFLTILHRGALPKMRLEPLACGSAGEFAYDELQNATVREQAPFDRFSVHILFHYDQPRQAWL